MDEFSLIDSIKQTYYSQPTLIKGIGDDAAVIRQSASDIVTAVDTFVEGVHFRRDTMEPFHVGFRALAANLSDLAAMGATPAFYLASIVIPKTWTEIEIAEIFAGMKKMAGKYHMDLIGGDTVSGKELSLSITVIGYVDHDKIRYRHTAKAGDIVFVTGTLGDSQAGFHILTNPSSYDNAAYFIKRHQLPTPQIDFAAHLQKFTRITLNDVSDGIASEAAEIAEASRVTIQLEDNRIPVHETYNQFPSDSQYNWKYFGGEDFELLGTVPSADWSELKSVAKLLPVRITKIGKVINEDTSGKVYINKDGRNYTLPKQGYTHLK
ncbi:MAG: thiamine-phosphate kinase [Bacillota bacterium]